MRRTRVLITLAVLLLFAGCAPSGEKTLHVAMSLTEQEWKVMREDVFPRFEEETGWTVRSYQIQSGQLEMKLEALARAGKAKIDVFAQDNMSLASLVNKGLVEDLSAYEEDIDDHVMPNIILAGKFEKRLLFMPFRPNVQVAYYNENAFSKYGLNPPRNWEELIETARTFKEKEGVGRFVFKAYGGNPTATQVYEFILQAGGDPYSFDDEGCVRAFAFLQSLRPYFSPDSNRAKWDTVNDILAKQNGYLAQNWPFGVLILIDEYKLDFIRTYSGWSGPAGEYHVIGGDVFGIPRKSRHKQQALEFIRFMQSKDVQEVLVAALGWPSIRDDVYARVADWQKPYFDSVQKALAKGQFRKNVTWWPAYTKYISRAFQKIVLEGADVRTTLADYKEKLQKEKRTLR